MDSERRAIWLGNFDFEHRLRHPIRSGQSRVLQRINDELASTLVLAAQDDDFVVAPRHVELGFFEELCNSGLPRVVPISDDDSIPADLLLCPWGWTQGAREWGSGNRCCVVAPDDNAVIAVNSRAFSFELEQEWGIGPKGLTDIHTLSDLSALDDMAGTNGSGWLFKAEFGMAGRERLQVPDIPIRESARRWVKKRLQANGRVFVEPFLTSVEEVGMQFEVPQFGEISFIGMARLIADRRGTYRASHLFSHEHQFEKWNSAIEWGTRAAVRAQQMGYFGPFGVDAMAYRNDDGQELLRPLQDINARMTMGRLATRLTEFCENGEHCAWFHVRWASETLTAIDWYAHFQRRLSESTRAIRTSAFEIDSMPTSHGTIAVFAKSPDELNRVESSVFADQISA